MTGIIDIIRICIVVVTEVTEVQRSCPCTSVIAYECVEVIERIPVIIGTVITCTTLNRLEPAVCHFGVREVIEIGCIYPEGVLSL